MLDDPFVLVAPAGSDIAGRASVTVDEVTAPRSSATATPCAARSSSRSSATATPTFCSARRQPHDPGVRHVGHRVLGDAPADGRHRRPRRHRHPHRARARRDIAPAWPASRRSSPARCRVRGRGRGRRWSADVPSTDSNLWPTAGGAASSQCLPLVTRIVRPSPLRLVPPSHVAVATATRDSRMWARSTVAQKLLIIGRGRVATTNTARRPPAVSAGGSGSSLFEISRSRVISSVLSTSASVSRPARAMMVRHWASTFWHPSHPSRCSSTWRARRRAGRRRGTP